MSATASLLIPKSMESCLISCDNALICSGEPSTVFLTPAIADSNCIAACTATAKPPAAAVTLPNSVAKSVVSSLASDKLSSNSCTRCVCISVACAISELDNVPLSLRVSYALFIASICAKAASSVSIPKMIFAFAISLRVSASPFNSASASVAAWLCAWSSAD